MAALVTREALEDLTDLDAERDRAGDEPDLVQLVVDDDVVPVADTFGDWADSEQPGSTAHSAAVADPAAPAGSASQRGWSSTRW